MKFLCDQMLGTLAKWLRIYGFDTFYSNSEIDDLELINIAKEEKRILLTRDKELIIRGRKKNLQVIQVNNTDLDKQLSLVLKNVDIDSNLILSRCLICNNPIEEIQKNKVIEKVPKKVFENNDKFWFCKSCNKFYWKGSHFENMLEKIKKIT